MDGTALQAKGVVDAGRAGAARPGITPRRSKSSIRRQISSVGGAEFVAPTADRGASPRTWTIEILQADRVRGCCCREVAAAFSGDS